MKIIYKLYLWFSIVVSGLSVLLPLFLFFIGVLNSSQPGLISGWVESFVAFQQQKSSPLLSFLSMIRPILFIWVIVNIGIFVLALIKKVERKVLWLPIGYFLETFLLIVVLIAGMAIYRSSQSSYGPEGIQNWTIGLTVLFYFFYNLVLLVTSIRFLAKH